LEIVCVSVVVAIAFVGAVIAFFVYRRERESSRRIPVVRATEPRRRDLWRALGLHCVLLPLYGFYGLAGVASGTGWGGFAVLGALWLVVVLLLVIWWSEGREGLGSRVVIWALVVWLTVFLLLLLPWRRTRSWLVPLRSPAGTEPENR
jgi:hypothetical protein